MKTKAGIHGLGADREIVLTTLAGVFFPAMPRQMTALMYTTGLTHIPPLRRRSPVLGQDIPTISRPIDRRHQLSRR